MVRRKPAGQPYGSYYNYATFYNPQGTFISGGGVSTPATETRADGRATFDGWGVSANVDWKLADRLALKSITAYRAYDSTFSNDNDLSPLAASLGFGETTFHSISEELRLNGSLLEGNRLEYTVGGFFMDQRTIYSTTQDLRYSAGALTAFNGDDPVNADTQAGFVHLSFLATDELTLNAGLRYTQEHKDYTFSRRTRMGAVHPSLGAIDGVKTDYDGDRWDYRVNVQYQWTPAVMTYAQVATGFKGGGVSPRPFNAAQAVPFGPEELTSWELGLKSDLFNRLLRVNAAVFFSDYNDVQLGLASCPQYNPPTNPNGPCSVLTNAGDAQIKGLEIETVLRPIDHLSIDASYAYMDFKYTYINPAVGPSGPQYGMTQPYSPRNKWSFGAQYEIGIGDRGTLTPRVDVAGQSRSWANGRNAPTNLIDAYVVANARVAWRSPDEAWEAAAEVTNFTNEYYFTTRFDQYTSTGVTDGQPGRPREWAITLKRRF